MNPIFEGCLAWIFFAVIALVCVALIFCVEWLINVISLAVMNAGLPAYIAIVSICIVIGAVLAFIAVVS